MEPISVQFELTPEDVVDGLRAFDRRNTYSAAGIAKRGAVALAAGLAWAVLIRRWWVVPLLVFVLSQMTIVEAVFSRRRQAKRMFRDPDQRGPYSFTFDDSGLHVRSPKAASSVDWSAYKAVVETDRAFFLYSGAYEFVTVPKRAFHDEQEMRAFRDLLQDKVAQRPL